MAPREQMSRHFEFHVAPAEYLLRRRDRDSAIIHRERLPSPKDGRVQRKGLDQQSSHMRALT